MAADNRNLLLNEWATLLIVVCWGENTMRCCRRDSKAMFAVTLGGIVFHRQACGKRVNCADYDEGQVYGF
jgi:hypothetical protein